MNEQEKKRIINHLMHHSAHRGGIVYDFAMLCSGMMSAGCPYGDGQTLTMTEVSVILEIMHHPGVTAAQLCKKWNRTRGAVSQLLKKLEQKELIYREKKRQKEKDADAEERGVGLYTTSAGFRIAAEVISNEREDSSRLFSTLLERNCTQQELEAFYKVMDCYIGILQEGKAGNWHELLPQTKEEK